MPAPEGTPAIVVIGGGITGLAAAWELVGGAGAGGARVEVLEAADVPGGKLQAVRIGDRCVDVAADSFVARRPEATDLATELGIADEVVEVAASGASVYARGRLRPLPAGLALGVPTRWWPLARSGILPPLGSLRAGLDLVRPGRSRPPASGPVPDRPVGDVVGARLGRAVVDRLADPLIGGINAGSVDRLSSAAAFPGLLAAAARGGSLMRALRPPVHASGQPAAPAARAMFATVRGGTSALASRLAGALAEHGAVVRTGTRVTGLAATGSGWRVELAAGQPLDVDGVVLALPAPAAAGLLAGPVPGAGALLAGVDYASVSIVTLTWPEAGVPTPLTGTGFLVPRSTRLCGRAALVTGCTYLDRKWPDLARPGEVLLRASVGRFGDDRDGAMDDGELVGRVAAELTAVLGLTGGPLDAVVTRWHGALPQYRPGHVERLAALQREVAAAGTLAIAGAYVGGVGIPACIGTGRGAARRVRDALAAR